MDTGFNPLLAPERYQLPTLSLSCAFHVPSAAAKQPQPPVPPPFSTLSPRTPRTLLMELLIKDSLNEFLEMKGTILVPISTWEWDNGLTPVKMEMLRPDGPQHANNQCDVKRCTYGKIPVNQNNNNNAVQRHSRWSILVLQSLPVYANATSC